MTTAQTAKPSAADIERQLKPAFATGDPPMITEALGLAARAHGMSGIATAASMSRQALYKTLAPAGNPSLATVVRVLAALGLALSVTAAGDDDADLIG